MGLALSTVAFFCGEGNGNDSGSCIVTLQDQAMPFMVYKAECLPQEVCKSVLKAQVMANNVRLGDEGTRKVGCHESVYSGVRKPVG